MTSTEYLSKDILEEEFLKVFKAYRWIQMLMGSSRVDVRDRFVTVPTVYQKLYTMFFSVIFSILYITSLYVYALYEYADSPIIIYVCISAIIIQVLTYFTNVIHVRFINNKANVKLYIKLQELDRLMKIEKNKSINTILQRINNGTIARLVISFFVLFSLSTTGGWVITVGFFGIAGSYCVFIIELSYCSNLLMYFVLRMRFINAIISNYMKPPKDGKSHHKSNAKKRFMRWLAAQSHNFAECDTDVYVKEIFSCFSAFQDICRFQIFLFFFATFSFILISFEFGIQLLMINTMRIQEVIVTTTLLIMSFCQVIFLCVRCETFNREVKETKRLSVAIMSHYFEGRVREKAKNMLQLIEKTPPCFSVYDMWQLDARVMLVVFNVVTTFLVTLLQFAFL